MERFFKKQSVCVVVHGICWAHCCWMDIEFTSTKSVYGESKGYIGCYMLEYNEFKEEFNVGLVDIL